MWWVTLYLVCRVNGPIPAHIHLSHRSILSCDVKEKFSTFRGAFCGRPQQQLSSVMEAYILCLKNESHYLQSVMPVICFPITTTRKSRLRRLNLFNLKQSRISLQVTAETWATALCSHLGVIISLRISPLSYLWVSLYMVLKLKSNLAKRTEFDQLSIISSKIHEHGLQS